jgi:hypothetical protein
MRPSRTLELGARGVRRGIRLGVVLIMGVVGQVAAQDTLEVAVEHARQAWMGHDVDRLVATSDTMRLNIPGTASAPSLRPGQAARLLGRYLHSAQERRLELVQIHRLADDHAYGELSRAYVVKGTAEEQLERVFLGFRRLDGQWRLREVRITP